jgi:UDP-2,3-diacylglucosamine hydrolase
MPETLFISDLHLAENEPETTQAFLRFARDIAPRAEALYVLGDLFEYWIGDDTLTEPFHSAIVDTFAGIARSGTPLFFMHGNRDFLLGQKFCDACGGYLLPDPTLIDLYGIPTLLMHGDTLCTDDVDYMHFRAIVRDPAWQVDFLAKPLAERRSIVQDMRCQSEETKRQKSMAIMDVALTAVEATLREHGYPRLIHGHTHRPAKHLHSVDGKTCERWVLTDWYGDRSGYLAVMPDGCEARRN